MTQAPHPLVWVGFLAFFAVALAVGVRLLLLASRTRRLPELCMGLGVLGIGPVGFGLYVAAQQLQPTRPDLAVLLVAGGMLAVGVGVGAKLLFNWRVYHPGNHSVAELVFAGIALLLITFIHGSASRFEQYNLPGWNYYVRLALQIGALLWGSVEALVYWRRMTRRIPLGLADPVVANRFLLWAIGAGAAGMGTLVGAVAQLASGSPTQQVPWVLASSSAHGFVAAVAIGLAFIPPAAYLRYVRARA